MKKMKKTKLTIIVLSTLLFMSCDDKATSTPVKPTPTPQDSVYSIKAEFNGVSRVFDNLVVYRDISTKDHYLLIVANKVGSEYPKLELNFKEPVSGWSDTSTFVMNSDNTVNFAKYTNEYKKVFSTLNSLFEQDPLVVKFTKFQFFEDGEINANMSGVLSYDTDTSTVKVSIGKIKLKSQN